MASAEPGPRVLVVADDLTGAADTAITWARQGFRTLVSLGPHGGDADVLAVDTDSRGMAPRDAAAATRAAVRRHAGPGCRLVYKKIDSTLRGHPGAEIAAAAEGRFALVAPAFPAAGRTLRAGRVLVGGTPLEATETWRREGWGRDPSLAAMLRDAGLAVATLPLAAVRGGDLAGALRATAAQGLGGALMDAETEEDLAAIAAAGAALGLPLLWAGSGGLARHQHGVTGCPAADAPPPAVTRSPRGPVLVAVGSLSAVARRQVEHLSALPGARCLGLDAPALDAALADPAIRLVVVSTPPEASAPAPAASAAMAALLAPRLSRVTGLVATGGETARALLLAAGVPALRLVGEVEPGVPLGTLCGPGALRGLPVVTKAGAFGVPETLARCVAAVRALPCAAEDERA